MSNKTLLEIKEIFTRNGLIKKPAHFACFNDGILTYHRKVQKSTAFWEISIIADDCFFNKEIIENLITTKRLKYISCRFFTQNNGHLASQEEYTFNTLD